MIVYNIWVDIEEHDLDTGEYEMVTLELTDFGATRIVERKTDAVRLARMIHDYGERVVL